MADTSEVKAALDTVARIIAEAKSTSDRAKANLKSARDILAAIPTDYAEIITTINGYVPTGAFETLCKDELAKLSANFQSLKTTLEAYLDALGVTYI